MKDKIYETIFSLMSFYISLITPPGYLLSQICDTVAKILGANIKNIMKKTSDHIPYVNGTRFSETEII
jgi:hypothetical protein